MVVGLAWAIEADMGCMEAPKLPIPLLPPLTGVLPSRSNADPPLEPPNAPNPLLLLLLVVVLLVRTGGRTDAIVGL